MADKCPDCDRLKYDPEHDDFCEVYTELRDARARIAELEAQLAAHARAGCPQAKSELEKTKNAWPPQQGEGDVSYYPGFRDRLDRLRALRQQGHTIECATAIAYNNLQCRCHVTPAPAESPLPPPREPEPR